MKAYRAYRCPKGHGDPMDEDNAARGDDVCAECGEGLVEIKVNLIPDGEHAAALEREADLRMALQIVAENTGNLHAVTTLKRVYGAAPRDRSGSHPTPEEDR